MPRTPFTHRTESNSELLAVLVLNPLGSLAAARPGLSGGRVTVFGRDLDASAGTASAPSRKYILSGQTVLGHQIANLIDGIRQFTAACFADLLLKFFTLFQQVFVARAHGDVAVINIEGCIIGSFQYRAAKNIKAI